MEKGSSQFELDQNNSERFESLRRQVAHMATIGPDGRLHVADEVQRAFHESLLERLGNPDYPVLNRSIRKNIKDHPDRMPINRAHNLMRSGQDSELRLKDWPNNDYPIGRDKPEGWDSVYERIETDSHEEWHLDRNLDINVITNWPDRGVLINAVVELYGLEGPIRMIDLGCGRNHIAKKLAYPKRQHYAYNPIKVVNEGDKEAAAEATETFNMLINTKSLPIRSIIGIDIQDLMAGTSPEDAEKLRTWSRHCFYPTEYDRNSARIFEFDLLDTMRLPEVKFFKSDITDLDHERMRFMYPEDQRADVAYMSTVGYQLGEEGVMEAIRNAEEHLKPNGLFIMLDFVDIHPDFTMDFSQDWPRWSFKTYVLDMAKKEEGFKVLFSVEQGGRPKRIKVAQAASQLAIQRGLWLPASDEF